MFKPQEESNEGFQRPGNAKGCCEVKPVRRGVKTHYSQPVTHCLETILAIPIFVSETKLQIRKKNPQKPTCNPFAFPEPWDFSPLRPHCWAPVLATGAASAPAKRDTWDTVRCTVQHGNQRHCSCFVTSAASYYPSEVLCQIFFSCFFFFLSTAPRAFQCQKIINRKILKAPAYLQPFRLQFKHQHPLGS